MNTINYKGYAARIEYSDEDDCLIGHIAGINDIVAPSNISIFPNPATNNISFTSSVNADFVEVSDVTGRKVGTYSMIGNSLTIETSSFSSGMYIYNVLNDKKEVINRGKFEVTK